MHRCKSPVERSGHQVDQNAGTHQSTERNRHHHQHTTSIIIVVVMLSSSFILWYISTFWILNFESKIQNCALCPKSNTFMTSRSRLKEQAKLPNENNENSELSEPPMYSYSSWPSSPHQRSTGCSPPAWRALKKADKQKYQRQCILCSYFSL